MRVYYRSGANYIMHVLGLVVLILMLIVTIVTGIIFERADMSFGGIVFIGILLIVFMFNVRKSRKIYMDFTNSSITCHKYNQVFCYGYDQLIQIKDVIIRGNKNRKTHWLDFYFDNGVVFRVGYNKKVAEQFQSMIVQG